MSNKKKTKMNDEDFKLVSEGLLKDDRAQVLKKFEHYLREIKDQSLGYQANHNINCSEYLSPFLNMNINNVGDPFLESDYAVNTKLMEQAVLDYYAKLWNGSYSYQSNHSESYWGYALSMGSTEGNIYAAWNARDYLSGQKLLADEGEILSDDTIETPLLTPIAFYSQETHYSVAKAMRVLNFDTFNALGSRIYKCPLDFPKDYPEGYSKASLDDEGWPLEVPSNLDGSIHIPSLLKLVDFFTMKGYPIFVFFNYGTTFKGAYDQIDEAIKAIIPILKKNKMHQREIVYREGNQYKRIMRNGFWFHVDGALGAAYMPYVEKLVADHKLTLPTGYRFPKFDFSIPEINSIVMSAHKWMGAPFPCGLIMTKEKYRLMPPSNPAYIGCPDTTFAGSRNGLVPIIMWEFLAKHSEFELTDRIYRTLMLTQYAEKAFKKLEVALGQDLWVERSPLSLTIRFKRPNQIIRQTHSLSSETRYIGKEKRSYAHIFIMDHVTEKMIDLLISDLSRPDAYEVDGEKEEK